MAERGVSTKLYHFAVYSRSVSAWREILAACPAENKAFGIQDWIAVKIEGVENPNEYVPIAMYPQDIEYLRNYVELEEPT